MKQYYLKLLLIPLIYFSLLVNSSQLQAQTPGVMEFGGNVVVISNSANPSHDFGTNSNGLTAGNQLLLNGFDLASSTSGTIFLAFATSGNGAGTDQIGGVTDAVLGWIGNATASVSSGTLSTDDDSEFSLTTMQFAYEQAIGGATMNFTFTGKRDGADVGTLVLTSPAHATAINLDFSSPTSGAFINIDELVITTASPLFGGFSIDAKTIALPITNAAPAIAIAGTTLAFTEGDTATQIDAAATVSDADGDADWNGGTLEAQITANSEAADEISIADTDGIGPAITVSATNILSNGATIGVLSNSGGIVTNGAKLTITFNSNATNANVQEVLQSLRYRTTSTNPGTATRTITITATDTNAGTNNDARIISVAAVPSVTSVSVPFNDAYITSQNLDFTINFDENIIVNTTSGTPQLAITIGATTHQAIYVGGTGSSALAFRYTVQTGDLDTDGIAVGTLAANNGSNGTLQNGSGTNANLTLNSVGITTGVLVDAVAPADAVVTTPASTITVNAATQTISGTHTENGVTVHGYADANNDGAADNTTSLGSATVTGNAWSFAISLTADAANNFVVQTEDTAGNTSNDVDVPTITQTNTVTWTGATDNDWSISNNWNPATVPSTNANITIPSGLTNYPTATSAVTFNSLTINSGASFIAQSTVTGSVTYKRALTANWHLVSSPLSGETIEDLRTLNTFVAGSGGGRIGLAPYNNNGPIWTYQTSSSTGVITSGQGYSTKLAAAGDISFTGSVNTGVSPINYGITQGTTNNFNLVGNPYTSYVNLGTFFTDNNAALSEQTVWMWNQVTTSYDLKLSGTDASFQIAPGQGFFVSAASNTNVTFSNTNQSHQTDTFQRSSRAEINLTASENGNLKATQIYFINGTTKGFDNGYDGTVFGGVNSNFSLYSQLVNDNQGKNYAIQSLPLNNMDDIVIPIGLKLNTGKEVKFSASSTNLPNDKRIYLEDRINEKFIDITEKDYTVTLTENTNGIGQFYLRATKYKLDTPIASSIEYVSLYKSDSNTLSILGLQTENASLKLYSLTGKKVSDQKFSSKGHSTINIPSLATGVYIVELTSELGKINKKIILE